MKEEIQLIWFKKNLRVEDNKILEKLNSNTPSVWVYFFESKIIKALDYSDFHLKFHLDCLIGLYKNLQKLNIPLLFLESDLPEGFDFFLDNYRLTRVFSHEETWNFITYNRDIQVRKYFESNWIEFIEYPTNWVVRRLKNRDKRAKIRDQRFSKVLYTPKIMQNTPNISDQIVETSKATFKKYRNKTKSIKTIQKWGEENAIRILNSFLEERSINYSRNISKPLESMDSCSRLSPYIASWCISIKYVLKEASKKIVTLKQKSDKDSNQHAKSINFFLARIFWQSHFIQKLESNPEIEFNNLNPVFDKVRNQENKYLIDKFFAWETGIPLIDAIILQLNSTGWCNFRSRAMLVSFICNTCMQPWQSVSKKLAKLFVDYEPWIHYPQLQMQSWTTWINTIRIYNPVVNWEKYDPWWNFVCRYIPKLKKLPKEYIHKPREWHGFYNLDYPKPIVDLYQANKEARDILWSLKSKTPKSTKNKIQERYWSRKNTKTNPKNQWRLF